MRSESIAVRVSDERMSIILFEALTLLRSASAVIGQEAWDMKVMAKL